MKTHLILLLALGGATTQAMASTDQAWAEHDKRVASSCLKATTLKQARWPARLPNSKTAWVTPQCSSRAVIHRRT